MSESPIARASPADAPAPSETGRILVVDDNEANRDALCRRLERRGYSVAAAADGPGALEHLARSPADVVILDIMMSGMNGLEVLQRIRQTASPSVLPVIMATAKVQSEDVVKAMDLGASDYVTKPLDFPSLLARVRTHLALKRSVAEATELRQRLSERNQELEDANVRLVDNAERTRFELAAAARVQESFLPRSLPAIAGLRFGWSFKPCSELAGDALNICPLDAGHVGAYVLDVSGHGVASALTAIAASRLLAPGTEPGSILVRSAAERNRGEPIAPSLVAQRLSQRFAIEDSPLGHFMTLCYVLVDCRNGAITSVSAGHPPALLLRSDGAVSMLEGTGAPIGLGQSYDQQTAQMLPGDRLFIFSDGVLEAMNQQRDLFGSERIVRVLRTAQRLDLQAALSLLLDEINRFCGGVPPHDDISMVAIERDGDFSA